MKRTLTLLAILTLFALLSARAQNAGVSVNANGTPADPSAMLDVNSAASGILVPRMTLVQRSNVSGYYLDFLMGGSISPKYYYNLVRAVRKF